MGARRVHLADQGRTIPYCKPKPTVAVVEVTHDLAQTTCRTCINLATLGRR